MRAATVYVVDDDTAVCETIAAMLRSAGYDARCFQSAEEFLEQFDDDEAPLRCLVSDIRMPGIGGLGLQQHLQETNVRMPIVFVTGFADVPAAVKAMKAGAIDFLEKPFERRQLLRCVQQALARDAEICSLQARRSEISERLARLTRREREVLDLLVAAHSTKEIATRLNINAKTVFVHRARVLEKMETRSVVELSRMMLEQVGEETLRRLPSRQQFDPFPEAASGA